MLPDWLPNIHPVVVHFPIAILLVAVLTDLFGLLKKDSAVMKAFPLYLYVLGTVFAVIAYFSGRRAADVVDIPLQAAQTINEHSDLALYTVIFFGLYSIIRLGVSLRFQSDGMAIRVGFVAVSFVGVVLLAMTADHGGQLVYSHGIGVSAATPDTPVQSIEPDQAMGSEIIRPEMFAGGAWSWTPGVGAGSVIKQDFDVVSGTVDGLVVADADTGLTIQLTPETGDLLFVRGEPVAGLEMVTTISLQDFDGNVLVVHNLVASDTYDFFGFEDGRLVHGRSENGAVRLFDSKNMEPTGWVELKSVSVGTHFRGYVNGTLATHGHGTAAPPGQSGILMSGNGTVRLSHIELNTTQE